MIDNRIKLTFKHDDNGVFADYSNEAVDYSRDPFTFATSSTEDYIYVGFYKAFNAVYFEFDTANVNANSLTVEVYNVDDAAWEDANAFDQTKGFTRSGFLTWDRTNMGKTEVDGEEKAWVRIRPSADHSSTTFVGANIVFSDDQELKAHFAEIDDPGLLMGDKTHILRHVAARNEILSYLRQFGHIKYNTDTGEENVTAWDLLDVFEIREAATFLALSNIFYNLSDAPDDIWYQKGRKYELKYENAIRVNRLTVDSDDDGAVDSAEKLKQAKRERLIK